MSVLLPDYAQALRMSSLPYRDELVELVRPAVFLHSCTVSSRDLPVGASRLGGLPDLPSECVWPSWQGKPLSFIAQINLSELPEFSERSLLPQSGYLFFFYDSERSTSGTYKSERGSFAVFYTTGLVCAMHIDDIPEGLDQKAIFEPAQLSFSTGMSEPGWEHPSLEHIGLSFEQRLEYAEAISQAEKRKQGSGKRSCHQILGYPYSLQYPVAWDCERARLGFWEADREEQKALDPLIREGIEDWELLLQIDRDLQTKMEWPGDGRIYYMIRRQDLVLRRFDEAWLVLQST